MVLNFFIFLFSVKWLVTFYYTYNNEEDLYIHSQDPFRNKHYTALTRLKHTQTVGEMDATYHTSLLLGRWMFGTALVVVLSFSSTEVFVRKLSTCTISSNTL